MPTATVQTIVPGEGNKPVKIKFSDGKEVATWAIDDFPAIALGATGEYEAEDKPKTVNGRTFHNWLLLSFKPSAAQKTPENGHEKAAIPPEVFEAKDRRIAMESAYSSAARILQALAIAKPEMITGKLATQIARAIYLDVQAAGKGKNFAENPHGVDEDYEAAMADQ